MSTLPAGTIASLQQDGYRVVVVGSVMLALTVLVVGLRFWSKAQSGGHYGVDDLFILLALACYFAADSLVICGMCIDHAWAFFYIYIFSKTIQALLLVDQQKTTKMRLRRTSNLPGFTRCYIGPPSLS
jgi:hypothetical protein